MISTFPRIVRYVENFQQLGIPQSLSWLTDRELAELSFWKDASRRSQWLAGRWVAKRLAARSSTEERMRNVEILSRREDGLGKMPSVSVGGVTNAYRLSISHSHQAILVGLTHRDARIGVDVASDVPETTNFRSRVLSERETAWIGGDVSHHLPTAWALKESIFKACGNGRKWDPRSVELIKLENDRVFSRIHGVDADPLHVWIRPTNRGVATAVWSTPAPQEVMLCS